MQLQEALHAFLLQLEADGRSPHTIGQYRRHGTGHAEGRAVRIEVRLRRDLETLVKVAAIKMAN